MQTAIAFMLACGIVAGGAWIAYIFLLKGWDRK